MARAPDFDNAKIQAVYANHSGIALASNPYPLAPDGSFDKFIAASDLPIRVDTIEIFLFEAILSNFDPTLVTLSDGTNDLKLSDHKDVKKIVVGEKAFDVLCAMAPGAHNRFMELVGCYQAKAMTEKNFINFYASKSIELDPTRLIGVVRYASHIVKPFSKMLREESKSTFVMYHTTGSSTHGLLKKFYTAVGNEIKSVFKCSDAEIKSGQDCIDNPQDPFAPSRVNGKVLLYMMCYLLEVGAFPDKYYFGTKFIEDQPPSVVKKIRTLMKRYVAIKTNVNNVDQMDLATLTNQF